MAFEPINLSEIEGGILRVLNDGPVTVTTDVPKLIEKVTELKEGKRDDLLLSLGEVNSIIFCLKDSMGRWTG